MLTDATSPPDFVLNSYPHPGHTETEVQALVMYTTFYIVISGEYIHSSSWFACIRMLAHITRRILWLAHLDLCIIAYSAINHWDASGRNIMTYDISCTSWSTVNILSWSLSPINGSGMKQDLQKTIQLANNSLQIVLDNVSVLPEIGQRRTSNH